MPSCHVLSKRKQRCDQPHHHTDQQDRLGDLLISVCGGVSPSRVQKVEAVLAGRLSIFVSLSPSRLHSASVPSASASRLTREYSNWLEARVMPYLLSFSENSRIFRSRQTGQARVRPADKRARAAPQSQGKRRPRSKRHLPGVRTDRWVSRSAGGCRLLVAEKREKILPCRFRYVERSSYVEYRSTVQYSAVQCPNEYGMFERYR